MRAVSRDPSGGDEGRTPRWRCFVRDQRGVALPMAMIFIALLTVLMISFAVLGQTEAVIGANHMRVAQARAQAESGFERALWALTQGVVNPGSASSLDNPLPAPPPAPYNGSTFVASGMTGGYLVSVTNVSDTERRIRSQGCVPDCVDGTRRAHRLIEAVVERFPDFALDTPCALCVRGSLGVSGNTRVDATTDTSCGDKKGSVSAGALSRSGNAQIFGADGNSTPNQSTDFLDNVTDPDAFDGVTFGPKHFEKLRELAKMNGTYYGPGYPNGSPASDPPWGGSVAFNSANKLKSGIVFIDTVSGQDIPDDPSLHDPADLADVLIHGNPFIDSEFQGWIIVNGSLAISGNMKINGLVYATNDFVYNGTGTGFINGLVVSQNLVDSDGTTVGDDSTSSGNSRIRFNCEATRSSAFVPPGFFLQAGTYRELEGAL